MPSLAMMGVSAIWEGSAVGDSYDARHLEKTTS